MNAQTKTRLAFDLLPLFILFMAFFSSWIVKRNRKKYLEQKESELGHIKCNNLKKLPAGIDCREASLVCGSVVVANNYFRQFLSSFRNFFGGEMKSYCALLQDARRVALVRMLEEAEAANAVEIWNIRYETSTIMGKNPKVQGGVEVIVYGTAVSRHG